VEGDIMKGEIELAGFVLTAEEWDEIDPLSRAQLMADEWEALDPISRTHLMATLTPRNEPWVVAGISTVLSVFPEGSEPHVHVAELAAQLANETDLDDVA
jgi:hypothetical protein